MSTKLGSLASLAILFFAFATPAAGEHGAAPDPFRQVALVEGVSAYAWPNGLQLLLAPDPSRDTATVSITYFVGSRNERYGQTGIAHLLEHMLFNRTRFHPDVPAELAARGGQANGATGVDGTMYYEVIPAREDDLTWALALEADRMTNAVITDERLRRESVVVRNELAMDDDHPATALEERLFSTAYTWHNYRNGVGGAISDLQRTTADQVLRFYRDYYRPDNAMLVIAGRIDPARALAAVDRSLGAIAAPGAPVPETHTVEPPQEGPRATELHRAGEVQQIDVGYHIPGAGHPDYAALQVLAGLVGEGPTSALHGALVEKGLAAHAFGYAAFRRDPGLIVFGVEAAGDAAIGPALSAMLATIENRRGRFSETDVAVERRRALNEMEDVVRSPERFATEIGDWAAAGDWRLFFLHRDRLEGVTASDVQRVAERYLIPTNRTVATLVPDSAMRTVDIGPSVDLASALAGYSGRPSQGMAEAFDSSPDNLERRTIRTRLSSGLQVALLPKPARGNRVHAILNLRFGDDRSLEHRKWAGYLTADMLLHGTARHTGKQLRGLLASSNATVSVSAGAQVVRISMAATRDSILPVLRLVAEAVRDPSLLPADFEEVRRAAILSAKAERGNPETSAWSAILRALHPYPPGDVRRTQTVD